LAGQGYRPADSSPDAFDDPLGAVLAGHRADDYELVAAEPGRCVRGPHDVREAGPDLAEHLVPGIVAQDLQAFKPPEDLEVVSQQTAEKTRAGGAWAVSEERLRSAFDRSPAGVTGLIEKWDGVSWRAQAAPAMAAGVAADLTGVCCVVYGYCIAVGAAVGPGRNEARPLVERWDGATWAVVATPAGHDRSALLNSVSCASVANCVAVGTVSATGRGTRGDRRL
jgi:hypothetical protein